ncbi:MAG TPA: hypothetical protein VHX63_15650 [Acidobacteriaceae bacterium]|nr:hypothetical protein [Acidobacteriaceae bacterium]
MHERFSLEQSFLRPFLLAVIGIFLCAATAPAFCQSSTTSPAPPKPKTTHPIHHRHRTHASSKTAIVTTPAAPVYPIPPVQQPAVPATIHYSGHELTIDARNSSLSQILLDVAQRTGLQVEGLAGDQRVFGQYGPGTVSQTLSTLLDGSPYNYVIIGGDATHPPKQLLLTSANASFPTAPATSTTGMFGATASSDNPQPQTSEPVPNQPITAQQMMDQFRRQHPEEAPQDQEERPPPR